ncbi:MAG: hydroxyacid dehydrogenase [Candidatus Freyarchaeum deiterrae]
MKIAFFETEEWEREYLSKGLEGYSIEFFDGPLNSKNLDKVKDYEVFSVSIYSKVSREVIQKLPKLRFISTRSTGFDHIDINECKERSITVSNVPTYGENTVAEHAFALILSITRNVHKSYVKSLNEDYSMEGLKGFDLKGKTLGVVGTGNIGLHVIRMAKGFGMKVIAYDVKRQKFLAEVLDFTYAGTLDELLKQSDIVSLHVPYSKQTHHMINGEKLLLMKKGSILINTARGGLVDNSALIEALDNGTLRGVGLDVIEGEEAIKEEKACLIDGRNKAFCNFMEELVVKHPDKVVFTPHIAFYSQEALERILDTTIENIKSFEAGQPENVIA